MPQPDQAIASLASAQINADQGRSVVSLTTLATVVVVCTVLYIAKDLFLPLALGMLVAFILTPLVNALRRRGLRDTVAVILTVLAAAALVGAFVLVLAFQLSQIASNLPKYQGNVLSKIDEMLAAGQDNRIIGHLQSMVQSIQDRLSTEDAVQGTPMPVSVVEQTSMMDWLTGVIVPALTPSPSSD